MKSFHHKKTEKGIFLKDFASFWIPHKDLVFGQVIRIVCSPPLKSSFTVFEWKQDAHKKMKTTICIKSWSYLEVGSMWKLNTMNDFQWCDPQALLEKYVIDADQTGDVLINPSKLKLLLPTKHVEEERLEKERQKKEQDRKEAKKGAPENLTKELLKEILSENGVTFRKSSSKRELIAKVLELRQLPQTRPMNGTCQVMNVPWPNAEVPVFFVFFCFFLMQHTYQNLQNYDTYKHSLQNYYLQK